MGYEDVFKRGTAYPPLQFVLNMPSPPAHGASLQGLGHFSQVNLWPFESNHWGSTYHNNKFISVYKIYSILINVVVLDL